MSNSNFHERIEYLTEEERIKCIEKAHARCRKIASREDFRPKRLNSADIERIRHDSKELYVYSNAALESASRIFSNRLKNENVGMLLFDQDGYVIRWYGNKIFWDRCKALDIHIGTSFQESSLGCTAIDLGLRYNSVFYTIGKENYSSKFYNASIYFAPIDVGGPKRRGIQGGIALAIPVAQNSRFLESLINSVAREIELQYFWFQMIEQYDTILDSNGSIRLDQSLGKNSVLNISAGVARLFHLHAIDFYSELESLLDPLPANRELWTIINEKQKVKGKMITISSHQHEQRVSVSTYVYEAARFHVNGMVIAMNSVQSINKMISKFTGNNARYRFEDMIGSDPVFMEAINYARAASLSDSNILLLGESGVGKDIMAQAIHNNSNRRGGPFVAVNCAAFSKELISSELFGYEEGAFTGAKRGGNLGKFELANHGTLFLDEIGDMPLELQAVLLRVLESGSFMKLGGSKLLHVNVRIIAATNVDLSSKIQAHMFREDLFYRLGVLRVRIPSLREHRSDILPLTDYFIRTICRKMERPSPILTDDARRFLMNYEWPGNIRELRNALDGIVQIYDSDVIEKAYLVKHLMVNPATEKPETEKLTTEILSVKRRRGRPTMDCSKSRIIEVLAICGNNRSEAARMLGISRKTLYRKMDEYGIE